MVLDAVFDHRGRALGTVELGGDHEASSPHVTERGVERLQVAQPVDQLRAAGLHRIEEPRLDEDRDRCERRGATHRIAAIGARVAAGLPGLVDGTAQTERGDREA